MAWIAASLAAAAGLLWRLQLAGHGVALTLLFWLAIQLLLELPAIVLIAHGGRRFTVMLVAILVPLAVFELLLAQSGFQNLGLGGDLQGVEWVLMPVIAIPVAIVGAITAVLAHAWLKPIEREQ